MIKITTLTNYLKLFSDNIIEDILEQATNNIEELTNKRTQTN